MILKKDQILTLDELLRLNSVIISWVGGSYGNFLYRSIHKFIQGFPMLDDDGSFSLNGSSHEYGQYIEDFLVSKNKRNFKIYYDADGEIFAVKKHSPAKFTPKFPFKEQKPFLHIKIIFKDKPSYVWATIQNIIKRPNNKNKYSDCLVNMNWLNPHNEDFSQVCTLFEELINNNTNNLWFIEEPNFYSIYMDDLFNYDLFLSHLINIAKLCNMNLKNLSELPTWHENFLKNQKLLTPLFNHFNNNYDESSFLDNLLKYYR